MSLDLKRWLADNSDRRALFYFDSGYPMVSLQKLRPEGFGVTNIVHAGGETFEAAVMTALRSANAIERAAKVK